MRRYPAATCAPEPPRVFYAEDKILRKCAPHLATVLVVDPFPAAARLLCDLLKQLGARIALVAADETTADRLIAAYEPRLIFTEFGGAVDGPDFVRRLRRGPAATRATPVVMCTAEATELSLKAARDSGVHEFLCKPFTVGHLVKRVEAACLKERDWIDARFYVGPDRRRFNSAAYEGPLKREADKSVDTEAEAAETIEAHFAVLTRVLRTMKAALAGYDANPPAALRALLEQSAELQTVALSTEDIDLRSAVLSLQRYLLAALETGTLSPSVISDHAGALERLARTGGTAAERKGMVEGLSRAA